MKNPIELRKEDVAEIMFVPLEIGLIEEFTTNKIITIRGKIISCELSSSMHNLPAVVTFITENNQIHRLTFFEIKWINIIKSKS